MALQDFQSTTFALDSAVWALRSDFDNYDDQMNMYVAVLAGGITDDGLAEATHREAVAARESMAEHLEPALTLATDDTPVRDELTRVRADHEPCNGFADQTGDVDRAVYLTTRGNL